MCILDNLHKCVMLRGSLFKPSL